MKSGIASAVTAVLLGASLVACGNGNDKPAVCASADDLNSSVEDLKGVDITSSNGFSDLQDKLGNVRSDFEQLKSDGKSILSSQFDAVDAALATLKASVDTATSDRTAANLTAVGAAAGAVVSSAQQLLSDVKSIC